MIYGLIRVSTSGQAKDGFSFEQQETQIKDKYPVAEIYKESYTGKTIDRPILKEIMTILKNGDMLVVTKLDRLARNVTEGIDVVQNLFKINVSVHVLDIGLLENTPMGKFFLTTLLAVAEMERSTIIERTQGGKMIARSKPGFKEGRPKLFGNRQIKHALELLENNTYREVRELTGISKPTLYRAKIAQSGKK